MLGSVYGSMREGEVGEAPPASTEDLDEAPHGDWMTATILGSDPKADPGDAASPEDGSALIHVPRLLPTGEHMKSHPFELVFASNKMPKVPITSTKALGWGTWLVDREFASQ
jgi:hypothetical protein